MHLKSITLRGFKSFPDRTRLEFGEGVSVVVGPNGSGKSNITDAVLWALGEQSPLAVRGQSMQDVIFAGGRGVQARREAEVELVLDNSDGAVELPTSELSIVRRLNRAGEGEYRLNGARCRLIDVLEVLSDTGMGKEAHSVISQGRVEAIVTSKPRDRRLLIEEAAGLGKHRKRRRRAQLKLERTQENLDRALDVEREARGRLRPLKRQAEAAELHARLERQSLEARWELGRDELRARALRLAEAEAAAAGSRGTRDAVEGELAGVAARREQAEQMLAERSDRHDKLAQRAFAVRAARERVALRLEAARSLADTLGARGDRRGAELSALRARLAETEPAGAPRVEQLEGELARLGEERDARIADELASLSAEREAAAARVAELEREREQRAAERTEVEARLEGARSARREAERDAERARRESARVAAELAAVDQYLRSHAAAIGAERILDGEVEVAAGFERALAAVLGGRLGAAVVADRSAGEDLLDRAGADGGRVLVIRGDAGPGASIGGSPPARGARPLLSLVNARADVMAALARLLADTWVVESLASVPADFAGTCVTPGGRVWSGAAGELRQAAEGGRERALEQRNRREQLIAAAERAVSAERAQADAAAAAADAVRAAEDAVEAADVALRDSDRARAEAVELERRSAWLIAQRREAPEQGDAALRRAQLEGELAAERRAADRIARERRAAEQRVATLQSQAAADAELGPLLERLTGALAAVGDALEGHARGLEAELLADRQSGEGVASELRACAAREAELQAQLRDLGEAVTAAEVTAQQARDHAAEARAELGTLSERLGLEAVAADEELAEEERVALQARIERLAARREQLGPVNPLAADEYREALAHVGELETQRSDLETALRELRALIRDTDREIAERFERTFNAAAENFEELVADVFPGGRGRLRLVRDDAGPRAVLGGQAAGEGDEQEISGADGVDAEADGDGSLDLGLAPDEPTGVEIEVTPAGKAMKRLSLLSGGEKAMTAIAFLFAVFLARPCPFYILDEVEAALDDLNIDRFLTLLRRYSERAQFIVVTHQKRTMEAADWLYGVSMGGDGVSKVVSRRLPRDTAAGDRPPLKSADAA
jgi:chromosome segregation protein